MKQNGEKVSELAVNRSRKIRIVQHIAFIVGKTAVRVLLKIARLKNFIIIEKERLKMKTKREIAIENFDKPYRELGQEDKDRVTTEHNRLGDVWARIKKVYANARY